MRNTGLLLIDFQKDFFSRGKKELRGSEQVTLKARRLLDLFREHQYPVVYIKHISIQRGAIFFLPQTAGAEIQDDVLPLANETVI